MGVFSMSVDRDAHGELVYTYTPMSDSNSNLKSGQSITLRREDVLHIPGLGFDGLVGYFPIEQQSFEYVKYTLNPWVVRWEQSLQSVHTSLHEI